MNVKVRQIEVEAATADVLEARAAELGISVSELLADLIGNEGSIGFAEESEQIAELDRRWADQPLLGRAIARNSHYRQMTLRVLNAAYVFQYRYDGQRLVMLRVFHGREIRD